eukprot:TRINITY_DN62819_c0_g1_i1.p2 TRINITY_DN62819_c0_g1~~TRINITY_DN62819_c0_g1_i1.p2  ORF type:complete len:350 (+),score=180.98 TRINITY_DN62819_c0_g1_i1:26-1051(+)
MKINNNKSMTLMMMATAAAALLLAASTPSVSAAPKLDCLSIPRTLCLGSTGGQQSVIAADATPKGLVLSYSFDDAHAADSSGQMNHASSVPKVGPGFQSHASAFLAAQDNFTVAHLPAYAGQDFALEMVLFLIEQPSGSGFVNVASKGNSPSVLMLAETRTLRVRIDTFHKQAHHISSVATIPLRRWTHVALSIEGRVAQLWINGFLDSETLMATHRRPNSQPLVVGNTATRDGLVAYLDNLRLYSRALQADEIQGATASIYPRTGQNFVRLACKGCKYADAVRKCTRLDGFHLCSADEVTSGVLTVARTMGWLIMDDDEELFDSSVVDTVGEGTGICCAD